MAALAAANVIQVLSPYRQRVLDHVSKQKPKAGRAIRIEKVAAEEQTQLRQAQESGLLPALLSTLVYARQSALWCTPDMVLAYTRHGLIHRAYFDRGYFDMSAS